jgi:UPF0755 protein
MSNRRPADSYSTGRSTGAFARSPAERLEPTRPVLRHRRIHRREPGRSRPLVRFVSGVFTLLLLVMVLGGGAALALHSWINVPGPLTNTKIVVIPRGEGSHEIATRLEKDGVISDRRLFMAGYLMTRITGASDGVSLKAGDYQIPQSASVKQVLDIIIEGKTVTFRVTVPEGLTSHQIVERLKSDANLTGDITEVPEEGALLPETFIIQRGATRESILENMRSEMRKVHDRLWQNRRKDLPIKTWQEAVILASIVEKETGRNDERERVAAVFVNRLRQNMRLQSDPTILYGLDAGKTVWNRPILRSEIQKKTAHNTYQIDGLPPTPICNPGRAAIEAVLNPANTKDLYFVADGSGGHVFSETLKDHSASVQRWRALEKQMRAKEGTPPSDTPTTAEPAPPTKSEPAPPKTRAVVRTPPPKAPEKQKAEPEKADAKKGKPAARSPQETENKPPATDPAKQKR